MGVRGFAPSMVGGPCRPRSSSKIIAPNRGTLGFQNQFGIVGIEALAKPIFVRGYAPSMEVRSAPARTALAPAGYACEASGRAFVLFSRVCQIRSTRRFACTPFLAPKSLRQIRENGVWGTNSGSVYEPLMGDSFLIGIGEGIEELAKPIFVRGVSPFYGWRTLRPNLSW